MTLHSQPPRQIDPKTPLYLNEYGIEGDDDASYRRRTAVLKLLERLVHKGVPIDRFVIQGHLELHHGPNFSAMKYDAFLRQIEDLSLKLMVTELDVWDQDETAHPEVAVQQTTKLHHLT